MQQEQRVAANLSARLSAHVAIELCGIVGITLTRTDPDSDVRLRNAAISANLDLLDGDVLGAIRKDERLKERDSSTDGPTDDCYYERCDYPINTLTHRYNAHSLENALVRFRSSLPLEDAWIERKGTT